MAAPELSLFAPADRRWRRRSGSASGSGGVRAESAARAARRAALKDVQKVLKMYRRFSHGVSVILGPRRWQVGPAMKVQVYEHLELISVPQPVLLER